MSIGSWLKKAATAVVSHVGGALAGLATGWFTTPVGEISRSFRESIHREGSVGGDVVVGNLILLPFYIALGPLYGAYRGLRHGFSHGLQGSLHDSLEHTREQIQSWEEERERNRLPGNKMRDVYEYYATHSPQPSPRAAHSTHSRTTTTLNKANASSPRVAPTTQSQHRIAPLPIPSSAARTTHSQHKPITHVQPVSAPTPANSPTSSPTRRSV